MLTQAPNSPYKFGCFDNNSVFSVITVPGGKCFCRFFSKIYYPLFSVLFILEKVIVFFFIFFFLIFSVES